MWEVSIAPLLAGVVRFPKLKTMDLLLFQPGSSPCGLWEMKVITRSSTKGVVEHVPGGVNKANIQLNHVFWLIEYLFSRSDEWKIAFDEMNDLLSRYGQNAGRLKCNCHRIDILCANAIRDLGIKHMLSWWESIGREDLTSFWKNALLLAKEGKKKANRLRLSLHKTTTSNLSFRANLLPSLLTLDPGLIMWIVGRGRLKCRTQKSRGDYKANKSELCMLTCWRTW